MHLIITSNVPEDYVVATGQTHSVRELCEYVFNRLDLDYKDYVLQNPKYMRPQELEYLRGDATKIKESLGWEPKYNFETLLDEMIEFWAKKLA
jgi:GDPmannose 4,6-dehydratase